MAAVLVLSLFLLIGCVLLIKGFAFFHEFKKRGWDQCDGQVINLYDEQDNVISDLKELSSSIHKFRILYGYTHQGKAYISDKINSNKLAWITDQFKHDRAFNKVNSCQKLIESIIEDKSLKVYVNPLHPEEACLTLSITGYGYRMLSGITLILFATTFGLFFGNTYLPLLPERKIEVRKFNEERKEKLDAELNEYSMEEEVSENDTVQGR